MAESHPEITGNPETSPTTLGYTETSYLFSAPVIKPRVRRADVDVIMIFLTYGIYLFHLCRIYTPNGTRAGIIYPNMSDISVSEDPFTTIYLGHILHWFTGFMHAWNMPMFFYLSGQNAYSALFRRSETKFRDERVHRLLVPTLFLCAVTQFPFTMSYFAPRDTPLVEESYWEYAIGFYRFPYFHQSWFLLYLFIFAQVFTFWFRTFHPAHNTAETTTLSFCGSTACCCTVKPFSRITRYICCLNFLFKPALTPEEFVSAVKWYLGGPIRLALIPGIVIGVVETAHLLYGGYFRSFPIFSYLAVFLMGYATAAADKEIRQHSKVWAWSCLSVGTVLCSVFGVGMVIYGKDNENNEAFTSMIGMVIYGEDTSKNRFITGLLGGFTRGIGQWLFLIGSIALAREIITTPQDWHQKCRVMAMPFYLIHQQLLDAFAAGALWVPYLRTFPVMLIITSVLILIITYLITKSGSLRYFFGLPTPGGSWLPGKPLRGFVPVLVLTGVLMLQIILARNL